MVCVDVTFDGVLRTVLLLCSSVSWGLLLSSVSPSKWNSWILQTLNYFPPPRKNFLFQLVTGGCIFYKRIFQLYILTVSTVHTYSLKALCMCEWLLQISNKQVAETGNFPCKRRTHCSEFPFGWAPLCKICQGKLVTLVHFNFLSYWVVLSLISISSWQFQNVLYFLLFATSDLHFTLYNDLCMWTFLLLCICLF